MAFVLCQNMPVGRSLSVLASHPAFVGHRVTSHAWLIPDAEFQELDGFARDPKCSDRPLQMVWAPVWSLRPGVRVVVGTGLTIARGTVFQVHGYPDRDPRVEVVGDDEFWDSSVKVWDLRPSKRVEGEEVDTVPPRPLPKEEPTPAPVIVSTPSTPEPTPRPILRDQLHLQWRS